MRLAHFHPAARSVSNGVTTQDFDAFVNRVFGHDLGASTTRHPVDVREDLDTLTLDADLPGYTREQVDVTIDNDVLTIVADRTATPSPTPDDKTTWHLRERRAGRVERAFKLPNTVDAGSVDAKLTDGVLTITLKKRQEAKPRKIAIA